MSHDGHTIDVGPVVTPKYRSRWWIHRVDGEPIHDETVYIDGGHWR